MPRERSMKTLSLATGRTSGALRLKKSGVKSSDRERVKFESSFLPVNGRRRPFWTGTDGSIRPVTRPSDAPQNSKTGRGRSPSFRPVIRQGRVRRIIEEEGQTHDWLKMSDSGESIPPEALSARSARKSRSRKKGLEKARTVSDSEEGGLSETDDEPVVTRQKNKRRARRPIKADVDSSSDSGSDETDATTEGNPFICSHCGHKHGSQRYISPIPKHLLQTNDPPLESEQVSLQQIIDDADSDQEIAEVDDSISRAEYLLRCLRRRRLEIQASALAAKGVTSAIRRVPREVIMTIVFYALGDDVGATTLDVSKGPWVYSQVCRLWREEILSCRAIWGDLDIDLPKEEKGCGQWPAALTTALARANPRNARNHRLVIKLQLASGSELAQKLLQTLIESSPFWVEATLILPRTALSRLKKLKGRLPLLRNIRINHTSTVSLDAKGLHQLFKSYLGRNYVISVMERTTRLI
ncbi:hypothetical protein C8J56DRAFT_883713 [Mycena floridula]|nr:hypothetical protein C8J56DRAFT_883713 [Mycena floridula]